MVDKFIGDAIMAGFGVPIAHEDDEDRAVRAAINMIKRLREWNVQRELDGKLPVDMGIGLNTDSVVSGEYRLLKTNGLHDDRGRCEPRSTSESACKAYAARILISEFTHQNLKGTYQVRHIDEVIVKGKTEPVGVYEILDFHDAESFPNLMEVVGHFKEVEIISSMEAGTGQSSRSKNLYQPT